jgi:hypothetical protein
VVGFPPVGILPPATGALAFPPVVIVPVTTAGTLPPVGTLPLNAAGGPPPVGVLNITGFLRTFAPSDDKPCRSIRSIVGALVVALRAVFLGACACSGGVTRSMVSVLPLPLPVAGFLESLAPSAGSEAFSLPPFAGDGRAGDVEAVFLEAAVGAAFLRPDVGANSLGPDVRVVCFRLGVDAVFFEAGVDVVFLESIIGTVFLGPVVDAVSLGTAVDAVFFRLVIDAVSPGPAVDTVFFRPVVDAVFGAGVDAAFSFFFFSSGGAPCPSGGKKSLQLLNRPSAV